MNLPWEPLLTVERSNLPEVTIHGIVSVIDGSGRLLVSQGEQSARIWTRSCLKPWQLLNHLHILKEHYPKLQDRHFALMLSSHSSEEIHQKALDEMLAIAGVTDSVLQNTPRFPVNAELRVKYKSSGQKPTSRWGSCSGKHLGFVMAMNALGQDSSRYLEPSQEHFVRMRKVLAYLLNENWENIPQTTDGCRLPNYAFTTPQIARLYLQMASGLESSKLSPAPEELRPVIANFAELAKYMSEYPEYVGGQERFDTELMKGQYTEGVKLLAKEGADGLLTIGLMPCPAYPSGLGIAVKSSAGDEPKFLKMIVLELLHKLKLLSASARKENPYKHLEYKFNFELLPESAMTPSRTV